MCGIVGYISHTGLNKEKSLQSLHHRGPDNYGMWNDTAGDKHLFLGHTRLSIQDLSEAGNQPMRSEDGNLILVFNGEIYNFKELKKEFFPADTFRSHTDTEVILKMYQKFGAGFVRYLNGAFAIALFDKSENKLHLFRDRLGIKPLYVYCDDDTFAFASELKAFKALGLPFLFQPENVQNYLVFKYLPENQTLIKNVRKFPPATHGIIIPGTLQQENKQYWQPDFSGNSTLTEATAREELFGLLQSSVNYRLIADVSIGNFLSGGIDSSIIAYFLREKNAIMHYCAVKSRHDIKKEGTTSDAQYARLLAERWHLPFIELPIGSNNTTQELIRKTVFYADDLIADGSQIPSYLITQKASSGSRVILSGMGADELFFGYAGHQLILLDRYLQKIPGHKEIARFFNTLHAGKGHFKAFKRYLVKVGKYHHLYPEKYGFYNIVGDYQNALFILNRTDESSLTVLKNYFTPDVHPFVALHQFEKNNFLQKNLNYLDRMAMANNVESRVPFLDHRIAEFAYSLPRHLKLNNRLQTKYVIKKTFAPYLPSQIIKRRKAGFGMPLRSIFSDDNKINELLDWQWVNDMQMFNVKALQQIILRHINGEEDNSALIYAVISLQEWYKLWIENE